MSYFAPMAVGTPITSEAPEREGHLADVASLGEPQKGSDCDYPNEGCGDYGDGEPGGVEIGKGHG